MKLDVRQEIHDENGVIMKAGPKGTAELILWYAIYLSLDNAPPTGKEGEPWVRGELALRAKEAFVSKTDMSLTVDEAGVIKKVIEQVLKPVAVKQAWDMIEAAGEKEEKKEEKVSPSA